jgi:hypothetical protein
MDLTRFWVEFYVPIQEERKDFPAANASDVATSLIKARNWLGTFTEELMRISTDRTRKKQLLRAKEEHLLGKSFKIIIDSGQKLTGTILKNRDTIKFYAKKYVSADQLPEFENLEDEILDLQGQVDTLTDEKESLERLVKMVEKAIEWSIQYINWQKFELRSLND